MGAPEIKDVENRLFASELKCAIYSVDHRLAPESPNPAPVEDIYSVFAWLHANGGQLGLTSLRFEQQRASSTCSSRSTEPRNSPSSHCTRPIVRRRALPRSTDRGRTVPAAYGADR